MNSSTRQHQDADGRQAMAGPVEFFFDYVSPYAYLANTQLSTLEIPIARRPIAIVEVMKVVNNQPSPKCPPKARYAALDAKRWADRYGVPLRLNDRLWAALTSGAFDPKLLVRGALAAKTLGAFDIYHSGMFDAVWGNPQDVVTETGRAQFLERHGLAHKDLWAKAAAPAIEDELQQDVVQAAERGIFGVPTFFVDKEMFFGNDRLDFVRRRLGLRGESP
jgi:2-hydroxychromene-2-carboxylate isomerase